MRLHPKRLIASIANIATLPTTWSRSIAETAQKPLAALYYASSPQHRQRWRTAGRVGPTPAHHEITAFWEGARERDTVADKRFATLVDEETTIKVASKKGAAGKDKSDGVIKLKKPAPKHSKPGNWKDGTVIDSACISIAHHHHHHYYYYSCRLRITQLMRTHSPI